MVDSWKRAKNDKKMQFIFNIGYTTGFSPSMACRECGLKSFEVEEKFHIDVQDEIFDVGLILVTILIISFNAPVCLSLLTSRQLHHSGFIFILALAVADITVGLTCLAKLIIGHRLNHNPTMCLTFIAFFIAPVCASLILMLLIALDRLIAISNALTYTQKVTRFKICSAIVIAWLYAFAIGLLPLLGWKSPDYSSDSSTRCSFLYVVHPNYIWFAFSLVFLLPITLTIAIYIQIFCVTRKHIKRISVQEGSVTSAPNVSGAVSERRRTSDMTTEHVRIIERQMMVFKHKRFKRTLKAVRTLGIVIGCFVFTWFPFIITAVVQTACGNECSLKDVVGTYLLLLGLTNSIFNPLIYAYWNRDFRRLLKTPCKIWYRYLRKRTEIVPLSIIYS